MGRGDDRLSRYDQVRVSFFPSRLPGAESRVVVSAVRVENGVSHLEMREQLTLTQPEWRDRTELLSLLAEAFETLRT